METDDIYDDLNEETEKTTSESSEEIEKYIKHIQQLNQDIAKLCAEMVNMKEKESNLQKNMSELFKTAKAEVQRKDTIIADLRRELDNFKFRRQQAVAKVEKTEPEPCKTEHDTNSLNQRLIELAHKNDVELSSLHRENNRNQKRSRSRSREYARNVRLRREYYDRRHGRRRSRSRSRSRENRNYRSRRDERDYRANQRSRSPEMRNVKLEFHAEPTQITRYSDYKNNDRNMHFKEERPRSPYDDRNCARKISDQNYNNRVDRLTGHSSNNNRNVKSKSVDIDDKKWNSSQHNEPDIKCRKENLNSNYSSSQHIESDIKSKKEGLKDNSMTTDDKAQIRSTSCKDIKNEYDDQTSVKKENKIMTENNSLINFLRRDSIEINDCKDNIQIPEHVDVQSVQEDNSNFRYVKKDPLDMDDKKIILTDLKLNENIVNTIKTDNIGNDIKPTLFIPQLDDKQISKEYKQEIIDSLKNEELMENKPLNITSNINNENIASKNREHFDLSDDSIDSDDTVHFEHLISKVNAKVGVLTNKNISDNIEKEEDQTLTKQTESNTASCEVMNASNTLQNRINQKLVVLIKNPIPLIMPGEARVSSYLLKKLGGDDSEKQSENTVPNKNNDEATEKVEEEKTVKPKSPKGKSKKGNKKVVKKPATKKKTTVVKNLHKTFSTEKNSKEELQEKSRMLFGSFTSSDDE